MHESTRRAYLAAMGIENYVSRTQLPGAAATRRLAPAPPQRLEAAPEPDRETGRDPSPRPVAPARPGRASAGAREKGVVPTPSRDSPRFTLAAIVAGDILWLEELDDMPLAREQVQLVVAMAVALERATEGEGQRARDVGQFGWPIHSNAQFDQGEEAARTAVAAFIDRRLAQHGCRALVFLGGESRRLVEVERWPGLPWISTVSTRDMLENPPRKRDAWSDLQSLRRSG